MQKLEGNGKELGPLAFSPDGQVLASAPWDAVQVYDTTTGKEMHKLQHKYRVRAIAFSPDGPVQSDCGM